MKKMNSKQRNYLIIGLCAVVLLMVVGYAAFSSQLNITGTAGTTSKWNILITNVTSKEVVGQATNKVAPTWEDLTASFSTNLVSPGDSITYDITVENQGNLNAVLKDINVSEPNNAAIIFTTSGLTEGDVLTAGGSANLTVKVEYDKNITTQPTNLTGSITVTLDYEQHVGESITPDIETVSIGGKDVVLTTIGDGLYTDPVEANRYVYRGANPNNYIWLDLNGDSTKTDNETYRIVAIDPDNTIKVVAQNSIGDIVIDPGYATVIDGVTNENSNEGTRYSSVSTDYCSYTTSAASYSGCNVWGSNKTMLDKYGNSITEMPREVGTSTTYALPSSEAYLNTYLNTTFLENIDTNLQNKIVVHTYNVGLLTNTSGQTLETDIEQEGAYKWKGKVALINATDYVKSSINPSCNSISLYTLSACKDNGELHNYLFTTASFEWTLSSRSYEIPYAYSNFNWRILSSGTLNISTIGSLGNVRPAFYLNSNITLSGSGTSDDPYEIVAQ